MNVDVSTLMCNVYRHAHTMYVFIIFGCGDFEVKKILRGLYMNVAMLTNCNDDGREDFLSLLG